MGADGWSLCRLLESDVLFFFSWDSWDLSTFFSLLPLESNESTWEMGLHVEMFQSTALLIGKIVPRLGE
jgi:hypothetical protein